MHAHRSLAAEALGLAFVVMLVLSPALRGQSVPTITVSGNVYQANGTPATGSVQISWPAFTTAGGHAVAAGRTSAKIGANGKVTVALAPNIGAMPAGLFYTAVYHLSDGTTSTEYWVVPNTIEATIAQVRSTVLPAAQAVQAVNKAYVDQSIAQAVTSQITPSGGTLTGPLYLAGDPMQAAQAANKHYVDTATAQLLPIAGGALSGPVTAPRIGAVLQADQFPGADFGAQLQACVNALDPAYGGTCDARNFPGQVTMAANLTLAVPNVTIYLPCSTIATGASILVPGGTRNVSLHGCASRGTSAASGAQGGSVLLYSGNSALLQVGDPSFLADTKGFRLDNAALNTTAAAAASAQAIAFNRTQEISLASLYLLGNANQTAVTLDGTGNYTGGTFEDMQFTGFQAAINGIGHTVDNAATTDWLNASTFLRMHIDCATQNGSPVAGTTGINLQAGDGNTFTGGDVEGCATALHLGAHAVNNTLVGVRNENSTTQVVADGGSSYNNWITGGTMYTGKLVDNGTRNSFLDTFHRSFNGMNGDWYGSQQDATVTNHFRLGIGTGSERGLLNRYQTDTGYRWTTGLSDATAGAQFYQVLDELNSVYRLSIGQYNPGQSSTNNQTVVNAAGSGAIVLNGSNNAGTGGVIFGSGGPASTTVATVDKTGSANFTGTLQVGGVAQSAGTMTVRNNADGEVDYYLWPGATSSQKGSFTYKDFDGSSQWYMVKDQANNWALNSAPGGLDSFKAYQSTNSGDTYINAANSTGHIRLNYETGAGAETDIYSGSSSSLAAAFLGPTAIKLPGLAAAAGKNCVQIDSSGYLSNTTAGCGVAAAVAGAGLAFSDGTVQTSSQQGALTGQANDAAARAVAATAESDAQTGIAAALSAQNAASAAQGTADAALAANGATSTGSGSSNAVTFPGSIAAATSIQGGALNAVYYPMQCGTSTGPAWCNGVYFITQTPGTGYLSTDSPTCSISGGTVAAGSTAATCAAVVTRAGGLWFYVTNPGSYSVLPTTVSVGGTVSGSGASATPNTVFGADVGSWSNLAIGNCPVDVNGLYHCTIVNTATSARLAMNSTMHVPSGVDVECKGAALQWIPTVGTAVQLGSPHPGVSSDGHTSFDCALLGPEVTAQQYLTLDTSIGMTIGGDPSAAYGGGWQAVEAGNPLAVGSLIDPTAQGNGFVIRSRYIAGFHFGVQGGNNFYVDDFFVESWYRNYVALADTACFNPASVFAGAEGLNMFGGQFWGNRANAIRMSCGNQWYLHGVRIDYSNNAGLAAPEDWTGTVAEGVRAANAEIYGKNIFLECHACHIEHSSGPMIYTNQTGNVSSTIKLFGGLLVPGAPMGVSVPLTGCSSSSDGKTVTLLGNFPPSLTSLQGGGGLTLAVSGFTNPGPCAALNGLVLNDTIITSTAFTAYSSVVANGTDSGTDADHPAVATVPGEVGYIALNRTAGSEQVNVSGTYSLHAITSGGPENQVLNWVDNTGDSGAGISLSNTMGSSASNGPQMTTFWANNPKSPASIIDQKMVIDNHFLGTAGSLPDLVLIPATSGTYNGIGTGVHLVTDTTFRVQSTLNCNGVASGGFEFGPGGTTAVDTRLCRKAAGVLDSPGKITAASFAGDQAVTIASLAGAGTGATAVCDTADGYACTNTGGVITLVSGTGAGTGDVVSIAWSTALSSKPVCGYSNATSSPLFLASQGYWDTVAQTASKAVLATTSAISGTYKIAYRCGQ